MDPSSLHIKVRRARREQKLSQSSLAHRVGCKQSAISMFEAGRTQVLSSEKIAAICDLLGIVLPQGVAGADMPLAGPASSIRAFCPQGECPSNIPYIVADELRFLPVHQFVAAGAGHCRFCGEVLEQACPECGRSVVAGACCTACGCAYVVGVPDTGGDVKGWVAAQRMLVQLAQR